MQWVYYALNVYIFIKSGERKLKWSVVILFTLVSWTASAAVGIVPYFDELGVVNINGFCTTDSRSSSFKIAGSFMIALAFIFLSIQLICSILTIVHVKRNVLEGNISVKKAVAKVLTYLAVASILSFIYSIVPIANPFIRRVIPDDRVRYVVVNYILRLVFNFAAIATPNNSAQTNT